MSESQSLSEKINRLIAEYHKGGVTEADCLACSSACCSHGGFAILENVILIYEFYQSGKLKRDDYVFEEGLSFRDFVFQYFDITSRITGRWPFKKEILLFHMRSIDAQGRVIKIPREGYYYAVRSSLFERNPWLNHGCVFLSKKVQNWPKDDKDSSRHCLLHTSESRTHLTRKPIDCIFFTCKTPIKAKVPSQKESSAWFRSLAVKYPKSRERFDKMIEEK